MSEKYQIPTSSARIRRREDSRNCSLSLETSMEKSGSIPALNFDPKSHSD